MALQGVTDHVLDLLVGAVDDHAAAVFFDDDLAIVQLRLGLVVVGLIELIDGLLEGHMRRILAVVERHVDDVQRAHGATLCCMPLAEGLRTGEGVGAVVSGHVDGELADWARSTLLEILLER